jgi:16S rRNA (uracil1498-N3)-methyltransferase
LALRIPRFFIPLDSIHPEHELITLSDRGVIEQITKVLRLDAGNQIDLLDGRGKIYRCSITRVQTKGRDKYVSLEAHIDLEQEASGECRYPISVALPMLRPSRFEWALEKLTELGVAEIVPLKTERSVEREQKPERWKSIMREAAEQCERGVIPLTLPPMDLNEYFQHLLPDSNATIFICAERLHESASDKSGGGALQVVLCNLKEKAPHKISVIVGAEGGFTQTELISAQNAGAMPISLGKRILRSETAAVYAIAIVQAVLGEQ